jgi:hypothetical protein
MEEIRSVEGSEGITDPLEPRMEAREKVRGRKGFGARREKRYGGLHFGVAGVFE